MQTMMMNLLRRALSASRDPKWMMMKCDTVLFLNLTILIYKNIIMELPLTEKHSPKNAHSSSYPSSAEGLRYSVRPM